VVLYAAARRESKKVSDIYVNGKAKSYQKQIALIRGLEVPSSRTPCGCDSALRKESHRMEVHAQIIAG